MSDMSEAVIQSDTGSVDGSVVVVVVVGVTLFSHPSSALWLFPHM